MHITVPEAMTFYIFLPVIALIKNHPSPDLFSKKRNIHEVFCGLMRVFCFGYEIDECVNLAHNLIHISVSENCGVIIPID